MSGIAPYQQLAELTESAAAAAERGDLEELAALLGRCAAIRAGIAPQPPAGARPALQRAAAGQRRLQAGLDAALRETRAQLERAERGRRAARAYGPPEPTSHRYAVET